MRYRQITLPSVTILGAILVLSLYAAPAQATSTLTWVASDGTSNTTCSRTMPCNSFVAAHAATTAGGEIKCVDAGNYGTFTINKSISINCDNTGAGIQVIGITAGIFVNDLTATAVVTVSGLDIDGAGGLGGIGIEFYNGALLHVHNVKIRNFRANTNAASGIYFIPQLGNFAELYVTDSTITDSGFLSQPINGGIVIRPSNNMAVNVSINRVRLENNSVGISVDGTQTSGTSVTSGTAVNAVVSDTLVAGSAGNGITAIAAAGKAAVSVVVDRSVIFGNAATGVNANGVAGSGLGSALVRIGGSTIAKNGTGVSTTGAGVLQSFKDNKISGNSIDGTPIAAVPGPGNTPLQ